MTDPFDPLDPENAPRLEILGAIAGLAGRPTRPAAGPEPEPEPEDPIARVERRLEFQANEAARVTPYRRPIRLDGAMWPHGRSRFVDVPACILIHGDRGTGRSRAALELWLELLDTPAPATFIATNRAALDLHRRMLEKTFAPRDCPTRIARQFADLSTTAESATRIGIPAPRRMIVDLWSRLTRRQRDYLRAAGEIVAITL